MKTSILAITTLTGAALSLSAQTIIYSMDYDANSSNYSQNDSTAAPVKDFGTFSYLSGSNSNGVGGTNALSLDFDSTTAGPSDEYSIKFFTNRNSVTNSATTDVASQFTVDFSLFAAGLLSASEDFTIAIAFNNVKSANMTISATNNSYVDFSFGLDEFTFGTAPTMADINGGLQLVIESGFNNGDNRFGYDTGNALYLDNVVVSQIPEPSTFAALAGALALGTAALRRRRS